MTSTTAPPPAEPEPSNTPPGSRLPELVNHPLSPPEHQPPERHRRSRSARSLARLPYLLVLPALLLELLVHVGPMLLGVWISFVSLTQLTLRRWTSAPFVGLDNYVNGLDPSSAIGQDFLTTLLRTAVYTLLVVGLAWSIGLLAAVLLNRSFRGRAFFRTFFLVPFALPAFVTTIGWSFIFSQQEGALNHLLVENLGLLDANPFWLLGDNSFWVIVVVGTWRLWPFAFLMLLAALQNVPDDVYEAAALDGASLWRQFRGITLPLVRPANGVVVLVMGLWTFNEFTVPYVLFGDQPPEQALLLSNLIYSNSFVNFNFGLGAAMSVLLLLALLAASVVYIRLVLPKGEARA